MGDPAQLQQSRHEVTATRTQTDDPTRRPRLKDVAIHAGVATSTVSNVLNRPESVSPKLRLRVKTAIDTLGYVRNNAAHALVTGRSNLLGLVLPDLGTPEAAAIAYGASAAARHHGYQLLIATSDGQPDQQTESLITFHRQQAAGVILLPLDPVAIPPAVQPRPPVVYLGTAVASACSVALDADARTNVAANRRMGFAATERLLDEIGSRLHQHTATRVRLEAISH